MKPPPCQTLKNITPAVYRNYQNQNRNPKENFDLELGAPA